MRSFVEVWTGRRQAGWSRRVPGVGRCRCGRRWGRAATSPGRSRSPRLVRTGTGGGDRGQAIPLVAVIVVVVMGAAWMVAVLGARVIHQARVQAGADAVALAAAVDAGTVDEVAARNGVRVDSVEGSGRVQVVVSAVGGDGAWVAVAGAAAEWTRPAWAGLHPSLRAVLARAEALLGERIPIVSGLRTRAEQQVLWDNRADNPYPVAVPGTSLHERGLAVDVPSGFVARLSAVAGAAGLCQPLPLSDPVHFVACHVTPTP